MKVNKKKISEGIRRKGNEKIGGVKGGGVNYEDDSQKEINTQGGVGQPLPWIAFVHLFKSLQLI